ncbi:hypothetical protein Dcar01_02834 [Deinococcus carri]|uniref:Uncharacterized protein n=1 Tax=Deinococcus carri TaxID=1211323 RepID=A0ABP9WBW7_9DEIO
MSSEVPSVDAGLPHVQIQRLSGFRGQEDWGRWTLGKVATAGLTARQSQLATIHLKFSLPYPQQLLNLALNDIPLGKFESARSHQLYDISLLARLKAGDNTISLLTNKSNLSPGLKLFAPEDLTDMAVSLNEMTFSGIQPFTHSSAGLLYGASKMDYPAVYLLVPGGQVDLLSQINGSQVLKYRLLSATDGQTFEFRLDDQPLQRVRAERRGTLVSGNLTLELDGKLHHLSVTATSGMQQTIRVQDSVQRLEAINGPVPYYIQELRLFPQGKWTAVEKPLAGLGVLLCLLGLFAFLFGFRPSSQPSSSSAL